MAGNRQQNLVGAKSGARVKHDTWLDRFTKRKRNANSTNSAGLFLSSSGGMLAPLLLLTLPLAQAADPRLGTIEERARRFNETLETCGAEGSAGVVVTLYPHEEPRTFSSGSSHAQEFAEMLQ